MMVKIYFSHLISLCLGGYDLFKSKVEDGKWLNPSNLGNGVNSPEDDLFGIQHPNTDEYYVSSNRLGGKGAHDIYIITEKIKEEELMASTQLEVIPSAVKLPEGPSSSLSANPDVRTVSDDETVEKTIISTKSNTIEEVDLSIYSDDNPPAAVVLSEINYPAKRIRKQQLSLQQV